MIDYLLISQISIINIYHKFPSAKEKLSELAFGKEEVHMSKGNKRITIFFSLIF